MSRPLTAHIPTFIAAARSVGAHVGRWSGTPKGLDILIVAVGVAVIMAVWIAVVVQMSKEHDATVANAVRENTNLAKAFEVHTLRTLKGMDAVAQLLRFEHARVGANIDIARYISAGVIDETQFVVAAILDQHGNIVASGYDWPSISLADREYFRVHIARDSGELHVGQPVVDRVSGKWSVPMSRRINNADGSFGGIVVVGINPEYFTNFYAQSDLGEDSTVQLVGLDKVSRARRAGQEITFGRDLSKANLQLFAEQIKSQHGSYLSAGKLDPTRRYLSYRTVPDYRLIVVVGSAENEVLAGYRLHKRQYYTYTLLFSLAVALSCGLLIAALRQQRRSAALQSSTERRLDSILGTLQEVVWSMDAASGRITYINSAASLLTRRPAGDFLARRGLWRQMVHRDDRRALRASIRQLLRDGSVVHEFRIVLADGEVRAVESRARVQRNEQNQWTRVDGTVSDITERMRAEELQERQYGLARLQATLSEAVNDAVSVEEAFQFSLRTICNHGHWQIGHLSIFAPGLAGHYDAATSFWQTERRARYTDFIAACEGLDFSRGKRFVGKVIAEKVPVWIEDLTGFDSGSGRRRGFAIEAGFHGGFAFPVVVQDEVSAVLEFYSHEVRPPDTLLLDNITHISAQLARVVERARMSDTQANLAAIIASTQDGIISSRPDGTILTWNPGAEKLFGYQSEEAIGKKLMMLVPDDLVEDVRRRRQAYAGDVRAFIPYESERVTKNGNRVAVSVTPSALADASGALVGVATIYRDITERKQAEAALRRMNEELENKVMERTVDLERARQEAENANSAKSMFLASMSHEIRTPMNGVIGMIDVLSQSNLRGDQEEMVTVIRDSAFSLLGIINDILDLSKIEAGKLEIESESLAIAEVVESVGSLMNEMANRKNVTLTLFIDPQLPVAVMGDTLRVRQVLINLINNAIKFSGGQPHAGRVSVRAWLVAQNAERIQVEFRVTDNGIGMDDGTQARLFKAFIQADASTTRQFGGTGLGLAISNHLVELMAGEVTVQSAPGAGATFKVRLPFQSLPAATGDDKPVSLIAGLPCAVVGVPDSLADDLAIYLRHAKAVVERAADIASAQEWLSMQGAVSVLVIDVDGKREITEQLIAGAPALADQNISIVAIERGRRRQPRCRAPNVITVDGNCMRRHTLVWAVAIAAGRASLDEERKEVGASKPAAVAPSRELALTQGRLILIAEDNETNQKVIMRQLALLGHTADIAHNGRDALQRWRSGNYALLITDLHMPLMDGYELAKTIRAEETGNQRIPIIALTANILKGEAARCRAAGMDDYRSKPSPLTELKTALDTWMPRRKVDALELKHEDALSTPGVRSEITTQITAPVDVSVLKQLVGSDPNIIREFLQDFRDSAARIAMDLRVACDENPVAVAAAAHKLKSSALAVGATTLSALCGAIEEEGKAGDTESLAVLMPRFEAEMTVVDNYLCKL